MTLQCCCSGPVCGVTQWLLLVENVIRTVREVCGGTQLLALRRLIYRSSQTQNSEPKIINRTVVGHLSAQPAFLQLARLSRNMPRAVEPRLAHSCGCGQLDDVRLPCEYCCVIFTYRHNSYDQAAPSCARKRLPGDFHCQEQHFPAAEAILRLIICDPPNESAAR